MVARLFFFAPRSSALVLRHTLLPGSATAACCSALAVGLAAAATALAAYGAHFVSASANNNDATSGGVGQLGIMFYKGLDWSVPTFVIMMWIIGGGALLHQSKNGQRGAAVISPGGTALVLLAAIQTLLVTPLGQYLGGPNMCSNLRMHAGSNHLLLPTYLLHDARKRTLFSALASYAVLSSAFDGGLVRIEKSTTARVDGLCPGEISSVHSQRALQMLQEAGHSGRQFNPAIGRVLGAWLLPPIDTKALNTVYSTSTGVSAHAFRGQTR